MVLEFAASLLPEKEAFAAPKSHSSVIQLTPADKSMTTNELVRTEWLSIHPPGNSRKSGSAEQCTFVARDYQNPQTPSPRPISRGLEQSRIDRIID
jgi:hypothetical protein